MEAATTTTDDELRALVQTECEGLLQTVLAARQDLRDWLDGDARRASVEQAEDALRGCVAVLQTVLQASRCPGGAPDAELTGRARGIVGLLSGPFALGLPDGHVLYLNRAATELLGRGRLDVNSVPLSQRTWADRDRVLDHLAETVREGHCTDVIGMRLDGLDAPPRRVVLRTERLDEEVGGQPLLLMTFDPC